MDNLTAQLPVLRKMLRDRGYTVDEGEGAADVSVPPSLQELEKNGEVRILATASSEGGQCFALAAVTADGKIGVSAMRKLQDACREAVLHSIVVLTLGATPFSRKELSESDARYTIQFFSPEELLFDVTQNFLVPVHRKVNKSQVSALVAKFGDLNLWPVLPYDDRIARHYDFRPDDVVEIERKWGDHREITYRVVAILN